MKLAPELSITQTRLSVSDAKLAYFQGNFERCLEICARIRVSSVTTASEVALLTARAYLRSGRPGEARTTIADSRETHRTLDAWLTAQMLDASACIRQDDAVTGIAMLVEAARHAAGAHFAIRSEIALCTALGYWATREIDLAETYLALVDPRSDIIHARALELQAWCHTVRRDYPLAAEFFRLTLVRLDDCEASDTAVAATALSTLAIFAAELFDRELADFLNGRLEGVDWPSGLRVQHFITLAHQALFEEFAGNTLAAYQIAERAQECAPTAALRVSGWALRSAIAKNSGERYAAAAFARNAQELLDTLAPQGLSGEERFALLAVAESCAQENPSKAADLLARYDGLKPIDAMLASADDPRRTAYESFVSGVVAQAGGYADLARLRYREAFETFKAVGYVRRAVMAAHALIKLAYDADLLAYITAQIDGTVNYIRTSLQRLADVPNAALERHPLLAALPPMQREVVVLVCMGKSNKEIAQLRAVGEQTIKNMLSKSIFPAFGVSSRVALVSAFLKDARVH